MKVKMLKAVHAGGSFRKIGDEIEVNEDQSHELIRTKLAEVVDETKKPKKKAQYKV